MNRTCAGIGERGKDLNDYPTPKLDPQPTRIQLGTTGVVRVYDNSGMLVPELSGYYLSVIDAIIDRWPNRAIALVENYAAESAPVTLAWFMPVRVHKPGT